MNEKETNELIEGLNATGLRVFVIDEEFFDQFDLDDEEEEGEDE